MAAVKSAQNPHKWPNGEYHSIPWTQELQNRASKAAKPQGVGAQIMAAGDAWYTAKGIPNPNGPGSAAPAAPAGPGSPAPQGPLPLPIDAAYDDQTETLGKGLAQRQASIRGARQRGLIDYGYNEDPTNGALALDPNNPFSKATLLKAQYDRDRRATGLGMGARGQLYAGAMQTGQDFSNYQQLQGQDALQKSLAGFLAQNTDESAQAGIDYQLGMGQAYGDRTARAASNPLYSPDVRDPGPFSGVTTSGIGPMAGKAGGTGAAPSKPLKPLTIKAGPGVKATRNTTVSTKDKKTKKGTVRTYTTSVKGP